MEDKEKLIEKYSYYFNDSMAFVEEYFDNFKEMDQILKMIFKSIKKDMKNYNIKYNDYSITIENKKTKESYRISIEF